MAAIALPLAWLARQLACRGNLLLTVLAVVRDRASCKRTTTTPATNMAKHTILYFDFDFCTLTFVTKTHFCRIWRVSDIADIADITRLRSTQMQGAPRRRGW
jgi:hypothetical protein